MYSSAEGHLGYFHILTFENNATNNMTMKISIFYSFGYMPRSGIAGLYGNSVKSLGKCCTIFHSGCIL
jgi:hypothetical protein